MVSFAFKQVFRSLKLLVSIALTKLRLLQRVQQLASRVSLSEDFSSSSSGLIRTVSGFHLPTLNTVGSFTAFLAGFEAGTSTIWEAPESVSFLTLRLIG
jgi:hypothetical protein